MTPSVPDAAVRAGKLSVPAWAPIVPVGSEIGGTVCYRDLESSREAHSRSLEPLPLGEPTFRPTMTYRWKLSAWCSANLAPGKPASFNLSTADP